MEVSLAKNIPQEKDELTINSWQIDLNFSTFELIKSGLDHIEEVAKLQVNFTDLYSLPAKKYFNRLTQSLIILKIAITNNATI